MLRCDKCPGHECVTLDGVGLGDACPTSFEEVQQEVAECVQGVDRDVMVNSHLATKLGYKTATRVEEIMIFARVSGYTKIGLAFCISLAEEAALFSEVLRDNGFQVYSILCKNGALPREMLGNDEVSCVLAGQGKALCNPIGQAKCLNAEGTQLNVILGLCVGHDALFSKYSEAPATYLAVKDRITGHNPLVVLYQHHTTFKRIHHADLPDSPL